MTKVAIIIYSMYGHIATMAESIKEGLEKNSDITAEILQVKETLPEEVLQKMYAPPKKDYPVITPDDAAKYDAFAFGIPTRFGNAPAQWRAFWDATGKQWASGGFHGKLATIFLSTSSQHGGLEVTALNNLSTLVHHGLIYVPLGYSKAFAQLTTIEEVIGGGPWGAGTLTGSDGKRQPTALEKEIAVIQGDYFGSVVAKYYK